ncbi:MAG TPA: biopolymer transporter ExbD [Polyangiaceae bacterium]|jgi:biopolymer transport protein ExbD|nr:biopolymer transporter ExbD [Polyangiaceae bacterium]
MAATSAGRGGRRGRIVGINVTPMVDVTLVLLIIMMVSATYIVSQSLKVELPRAASSDESVARTYAVTVTKEGGLRWNDQDVSEPELIQAIQRAKAESPSVTLVVSADTLAAHGNVVHVIDVAKLQGVSKFAINVQTAQ